MSDISELLTLWRLVVKQGNGCLLHFFYGLLSSFRSHYGIGVVLNELIFQIQNNLTAGVVTRDKEYEILFWIAYNDEIVYENCGVGEKKFFSCRHLSSAYTNYRLCLVVYFFRISQFSATNYSGENAKPFFLVPRESCRKICWKRHPHINYPNFSMASLLFLHLRLPWKLFIFPLNFLTFLCF